MGDLQPEPTGAPSEHDVWAEHRAALDATLHAAAEPLLELELRDGGLHRR